MSTETDMQAWVRGMALASRDALRLLGWDIGPACLPGEPDACGGTDAQHTVAHLYMLKAVCDHLLRHFGHTSYAGIYLTAEAELNAACTTCPKRAPDDRTCP